MNRSTMAAIAALATIGITPAYAQIVDSCGYPFGTKPSLTSVVFNESDVLYGFGLYDVGSATNPSGQIRVWYNDEHALTFGVRKVNVKTSTGTTATDYSSSFTPYNPVTRSAISPATPLAVGATDLTGAQAATDMATFNAGYAFLDHGRPMFPALFITDITVYTTSTIGDWQQSGIAAVPPHGVYGTWKGAVRNVDQTHTPWTISVTPDPDPPKNNWAGVPDVPPAGFGKTEGYNAELVWNVGALGLLQGHTYRFQVMVHDGDQNKSGGDSGEACVQATVNGQPGVIGKVFRRRAPKSPGSSD